MSSDRSTARPDAFTAAMVAALVGLLAVVAVFALYATGHENLPLWLNVATVLLPFGLITALITSVVRTRREAGRGAR
jgi:uncharacterized protein (DUF983 family)